MPGGGSAVPAWAPPRGAAWPTGVALSIRDLVQNECAADWAALVTVWLTAVAGEPADTVLLAALAVPPIRDAASAGMAWPSRRAGAGAAGARQARVVARANVSATIGFVMRRCVLILSSRSGT
jgi:hypothetical protein